MNEAERKEVLVFDAALALASPAERADYLDQACAGDEPLRRRIETLLRIQAEADHFFESAEGQNDSQPGAPPLSGPARSGAAAALGSFGLSTEVILLTEKPGDSIGRYKLLEKIGEGGFGVVYMAEQREPVKRRVALKIIRLGMDTRQVVSRFEAERQALALMDHPNIAKVFDAGATESGRPYFVMELVRGVALTQYCDDNQLPTSKRLDLFMQVCRAVQHAHQKGIIHRDIKPSNLLVTLHDGVPVPKVIDFGIAKATQQELTEKTVFTQFHQFIGTPAYMSPEQAELSSLDIDTRSDIYSLGVLLYELLTGKTPFDGQELLAAGLDAMRRTIREQEPVRPSTRLTTMADAERSRVARQRQSEPPKLVHLLQGDLDWMVMKALEKDRTRRYETANDLAQDIQRHLDNEPIVARPPSNLYRLQKLARRNKATFAAVTGIAVVLLLGVVVRTWQAVRATHAMSEQRRARAGEAAQLRRAELNLYAADMKQAQQFVKDDNLGDALNLLNKHRPQGIETNDLRGFEWRYLWQKCQGDDNISLPGANGRAWWLDYSPDGKLVAAAMDKGITVFEVASKRVVASFEESLDPNDEGRSAIFTADGQTLITANHNQVKFLDTTHWTEQPFSLTNAASPISLSPDGTRLATMQAQLPERFSLWNGVQIWDLRTRQVSVTLTNVYGPPVFSPDGQRLATYTPEGIKLWPIGAPGAIPILLKGSLNIFGSANDYSPHRKSVAYSPDGRLVAAGPAQGNLAVMLWDSATGERLDENKLTGHTSCIGALAFSPDGHYVASCGLDDTIRIWDVAAKEYRRKLLGHLGEVWSLAFAPNGESLVSGGSDGRVRIWRFDPSPESREEDFKDRFWPHWISTNGQEVVTGGAGGLEYWNTITHQVTHVIPRPNTPPPPTQSSLLVSPDGKMVFAGYPDGVVRFASFAQGDIVALGGAHTGEVNCLAASPNSKILASASRDARLCWWEVPSMQCIRSNNVASALTVLRFSPDGKTLVGGTEDSMLCWWESGSGRLVASNTLSALIYNAVFSPDGQTLATVASGNVRLWDVATRTPRPGSFSTFETIAFSPDSRKLVTAGSALWDATDGKLLGVFAGHKQIVFSAIFSPDGRNVVSASHDGAVRLWSVDTQQELLTWSRPGTTFHHPMFSADCRTLLAGSYASDGGGLRVWHAPSFAEIEAKENAGLQNR